MPEEIILDGSLTFSQDAPISNVLNLFSA